MATAVAGSGGLGLGASPGSVRLEPAWRAKKRSESEAEAKENLPGGAAPKAKEERRTMLASVPLKAEPKTDLEREVGTWAVEGRTRRALLKHFPDLPALLAADVQGLEAAGLGRPEAERLHCKILALHQEPWRAESLRTLPEEAEDGRLSLSSLDLEAQLSNVADQLDLMRSQLVSSEQLLRSLSQASLARGGFLQPDNVAALLSATDRLEDSGKALTGHAALLRRRLRLVAGLAEDAEGTKGRSAKALGLGAALLLGSALAALLLRRSLRA